MLICGCNLNKKILENLSSIIFLLQNGITILEALSATGLRSIRYAKEIAGLKNIVANDINEVAAENIRANVVNNNVSHIVTTSHSDAV